MNNSLLRNRSTSGLVARLSLVSLLIPAILSAQARPDARRGLQAEPFEFQYMGPANGGRIASVSGVVGDPSTWYMGSASGGVWKSADSGRTFVPVFDSMPVQAIGALATAPSERGTVWAGTGEAWAVRDADVMGDGIYKSTDAGKTWTNMGLRETGRIGRIIVNPTNANIVYVCALGRATGPQQERGVYRTTDGGRTWKRVLFVDDGTGCSGLTLDQKNPDVLFAGMWQVVMHTWVMLGGGPSSGLYVSRDGGDTWSRITDAGLPKSPLGKIDVAVAPTNSNRVYALIQTVNQGSVWRSDDAGHTWHVVNWSRPLTGRAGYYIDIKVSPGNPDEVYVANSSFWQSTDGGKTFKTVPWGGDTHDIWMDPTNPDILSLTDDLGAHITFDHGKNFTGVALPNGQMYHVAADEQVPYWIYSNRQDDSNPMRGASDSPIRTFTPRRRPGPEETPRPDSSRRDSTRRAAGGRDTAAAAGRASRGFSPAAAGGPPESFGNTFNRTPWDVGMGGCESGFTIPDVVDPNIVWATCYGDQVTRWDARIKVAHSVSPWRHTLDWPPNDAKYRCHWTPPLAVDPFDHKTVYYGCQVIFRTSDEGQHWTVISPDLSTRDPSRVVSSGGLVGDNLGQFYGEVVFAIAPSEIRKGLIWAGTNDGKVWYTSDGGGHWNDVTKNINGLPVWGTVRKIEPSHFDPATAYVAVDFHIMDNRKPYIYKTTDYGKTWTNITGDLPATSPLDYVMAVTENPNRRGMLFAGTGHGFYYSLNDGAHWVQFRSGLPAAPVDWIVVPKHWHDVVVSTYGRGLYILRDVTALEQGAGATTASTPRLFTPQMGYRQSRTGRAEFTFEMPNAENNVSLQITDAAGKEVRAYHMRTRAGLNRVPWDMHYLPAPQVELRTVAPDNPHIFDEPRFGGRPTRPILHWGIEAPLRTGPLAAPGKYTVRLTAGGQSWTQPFEVIRDPAVPATDADLVASTKAQVRVRDDMAEAVDMINKIEIMRKQIADEREAPGATADVTGALAKLDARMLEVEHQLLTRSDLESDDKYFEQAAKVYTGLLWLSGELGNGAGDVAGGAGKRPTAQAMNTLAELETGLASARTAFTALLSHDVPAFNAEMKGRVTAISPVLRGE
jgi:photosystem II stability/assembly factor-like uncharacterized protein